MSQASAAVAAAADRVWQHRLEVEPFTRLQQGLPVERLRPESLADAEADAAVARAVLTQLDGVDEDELEAQDRLTAGFLRFVLATWVSAPEHHWQRFTVAPYSSFFLGFALQHVYAGFAFGGSSDAERYLGLVADYRDLVLEMGHRLDVQRSQGVLVPRPALAGVRASLEGYRATARRVLTVDPARTTALHDAAGFRRALDRLVEHEVVPAYDAVLARLDDDYSEASSDDVGAVHRPGGEAGYRHAVRRETSSDRDPESIHELGLDQVEALADEMAEARADLGFSGTEAEFHSRLAADPALHAASPADVETLFLRHMAALEPHLPSLFHTLPAAPYGVKPLSATMETGMTYGFYQVPTPSDPTGYYVYNGSDLDQRSMLTAAALILHELAPGHHFHMARQSEDEALPPVRRHCMDLGAFNEGWAEYAAGLGWGIGLYDDPLDRYGRLVHERFTAQRLVVDTGLNLHGWTLERARDYMRANTTESDVQVATETLRYATDLPGQALAYRMGFLELTRLRERAESALGERFDVRDFHEQVLGNGALPFPVLEAHLQRWAQAQ